jgi:hypothetical protein
VTVLTETSVENGFRFGFTDSFLRVGVPAAAAGENEIVNVHVTGVVDDRCVGEVSVHGEGIR